MPRGKFIMGALSVDRLEVYLGRKRNRLRLAGFGTFLPGPKMEGFRLAQNPTRAPWYISTYDVMGPVTRWAGGPRPGRTDGQCIDFPFDDTFSSRFSNLNGLSNYLNGFSNLNLI